VQKTVYSAGNGEVEVYAISLPQHWTGATLGELLGPLPDCYPVALTRAGQSMLPVTSLRLEDGDVLYVSSTFGGVGKLTARLETKVKA
jgi:trk system potassium uptake protein TrkA